MILIRKSDCGHWIIAEIKTVEICNVDDIVIAAGTSMKWLYHCESYSDALLLINCRTQGELKSTLTNLYGKSDTYAF